jgi:hypothetical protein
MEEAEQRDASALAPVRAASNPGPYGDGVGSGCGSGRAEIRRDRALGEGNGGFPIAHRLCGKGSCTQGEPRRQIGDRGARAEAACKAAGAMMTVMGGNIARVIAVLMRTRGIRDGRGEADRAAAHDGEHAEDQKKTSRQLPHGRNLSRLMTPDNRLRHLSGTQRRSGLPPKRDQQQLRWWLRRQPAGARPTMLRTHAIEIVSSLISPAVHCRWGEPGPVSTSRLACRSCGRDVPAAATGWFLDNKRQSSLGECRAPSP